MVSPRLYAENLATCKRMEGGVRLKLQNAKRRISHPRGDDSFVGEREGILKARSSLPSRADDDLISEQEQLTLGAYTWNPSER